MIRLLRDSIKFVFGCNAPFSGGHDWIENKGRFSRTCEWCGREQSLFYKRFGNTRYEWRDSVTQRLKDMKLLP
jgi:ribosomal protein S14